MVTAMRSQEWMPGSHSRQVASAVIGRVAEVSGGGLKPSPGAKEKVFHHDAGPHGAGIDTCMLVRSST